MFELNDKTIAIALLKSVIDRPDVPDEIGHQILTAICLLDNNQFAQAAAHDITKDQLRNVAETKTVENFIMKTPDPDDLEGQLLHSIMSIMHMGKSSDAATQQPSFDDLLSDLFGGSSDE